MSGVFRGPLTQFFSFIYYWLALIFLPLGKAKVVSKYINIYMEFEKNVLLQDDVDELMDDEKEEDEKDDVEEDEEDDWEDEDEAEAF